MGTEISKKQKIGIVDVGGGLRDIYAAGIFDYCMDNEIHFDVCVGVSAGSANVSTYLAGQRGRNYYFYTEYPFRKEYMSLGNFWKRHEYLNLSYVYDVLSRSDGENPFDYEAFTKNPAEMIVVATEAQTGKPIYFTRDDMRLNHYEPMKASSAIPFVSQPQECRGVFCYDGALSDPVPFQKAFEAGCDKVVVILSRPKDVLRVQGKDKWLAWIIREKYPAAAEAMRQRYATYNRQVAQAKELEKEGKILIISPDNIEGMSTLKKDLDAMNRMYEKGRRDAAEKLPGFLQ